MQLTWHKLYAASVKKIPKITKLKLTSFWHHFLLIIWPSESQELSLRNWLYDEEKEKEHNNGQGRLTKPEKPWEFVLEVQKDWDPFFGLDAVIKSETVTPVTLGLLPKLFQLNP